MVEALWIKMIEIWKKIWANMRVQGTHKDSVPLTRGVMRPIIAKNTLKLYYSKT
jgi:hypothetical protein